jgi:hypothetical protein
LPPPRYFQICLASHHHHHAVSLTLVPTGQAGANLDLYISPSNRYPTTETATWMSRDKGADRITISTYLEDFATAKSHTL